MFRCPLASAARRAHPFRAATATPAMCLAFAAVRHAATSASAATLLKAVLHSELVRVRSGDGSTAARDESAALLAEVDSAWPHFVKELERAGWQEAALRLDTVPNVRVRCAVDPRK